MSPHFSSESDAQSLPDKLDLHILHEAQMYLKCRQRRQIPATTQSHGWEQFYDLYDARVRRSIKAHGVHGVDAEDCRQDVWLEIMNKLPLFQSDGTQGGLCSWMQRIVHGKAVDVLRYRRRHPTKRLSTTTEMNIASQHAGPVTEYERHRQQEVVQHILAEMQQRVSALTYRAFYQHWIAGQAVKQIAAELNLTTRKVSCRIYHAKREFRLLCDRVAR
jgi:RNA polymerase sigma factor (sigma-70 family)